LKKKFIVYTNTPEQTDSVRKSGAEILAEYAGGFLIRAGAAEEAALQAAGMEPMPVPEQQVQVTGASFSFSSALDANEEVRIEADPNRTAYYLVKMIGPAQGRWLETVKAMGGAVHNSLPGYVLLIGIPPALLSRMREQDWVEQVTPYRPTMKVSPQLRPGVGRTLSARELARLDMGALDSETREQVQISVFPGESSEAVAAEIRASGGMVLAKTATSVTAVVAPPVIAEIAAQQGVEAILPHRLPKLHNDRATAAMGTPVDRTFHELTLRGTGQIVAVADSGLDTGNTAAIHADFAGRVSGIGSFPNQLGFASNDPPPFDDGAADTNSAHGTHVAGSVAGNGAAAVAAGSTTVPSGMAPEAQIFFQAIEQRVTWKSAAELIAIGITPPPDWPFPAVGLYGIPSDLNDLFTPAYAAGARIHTNSWGSPDAGAYTPNAVEVDQFMWTHRDFLALFSAGNEGVDANSNGVIDADSVGSPGTAKNCVTVGASENNRPPGSTPVPDLNGNWNALASGGTLLWPALGAAGHISDNIDGMAAFSSRGPTDDGRIKPDVTAPGTNVLSVRSSTYAGAGEPLWGDLPAADTLANLYCWSGGTSMSTPLVAGAAAIIRQHLVQQRGHHVPGSKPSGALLKAFLVNGSVAMAGQFAGEIPAGPNSVSGFGRLDMMQTIAPGLLRQTLFADEPDYAVESLQMRTFEVQAIDTAQPMRITLCWTDAPGAAGTGGLVNTLYLRVRRPDGTFADGDVTPFGTATNNVQQVVIPAPVAGTYEIRVHGLNVVQHSPGVPAGASPRQDFALVASNAMGFSLQPISLAQAIDTTGSMASFGYMEPARERANQLTDFLRANDKLSITEFSQRPALPPARTQYPLRLLGAVNPDWSDAHTAINALVSNGLTPIGAGLLEAWNQLSAEPAARPRAIVLLSDGLNNVAPDPLSVLGTIPADVPIFSVALGPAGSVTTLQNIAASRPNGGYFVVDSDEDIGKLHEIYAAIQALAAGSAMIGLASFDLTASAQNSSSFTVEEDVKEVSFLLSWNEGREHELAVFDPDGQRRTAATAATLERRGRTYRLVRVTVPKAGQWKVETRSRGNQTSRFTLSAAVQGRLEFSATASEIGRQRLSISARLMHKGKPLDRARVVARITAPTVSRKDILDKFGNRIREIQLPPEVAEPGLTDEQLLLTKLAFFAQQFRTQAGGLFERKTTEVPLSPRGNGVFGTEAPLAMPGNATIEVAASGDIGGIPWQRVAALSVQSPERAAEDMRPKFTANAIVNAASFRPGIVPGSLASLFGTDLSRGIVGTELPGGKTSHRGTTVTVDGHAAPLLSVTDMGDAEQINFQVPFEVSADGDATVEVDNNGVKTSVSGVAALKTQPGIFEIPLTATQRVAAVLDFSNQLVTPANPTRPGEIVSLYLTGLGPISPPAGTGVLGPVPPPTADLPVEVRVGGTRANVTFCGYAPGFLGLFQINFETPAVSASDSHTLEVAIGGAVSPPSSIAVASAGRRTIGA
jgi:uncharacterized protein (TIGR03437 family)